MTALEREFFKVLGVAARMGRRVTPTSLIGKWLRRGYQAFLDRWQAQGMPFEINGVVYRVHPKFRRCFHEHYEGSVADFLRPRIAPNSVCFDLGANIGVYVLQLAYWSRPSGQIVAFEPNPDAAEVLKFHIRANQLENRVRVQPTAVAGMPGQETLFIGEITSLSRLKQPSAYMPGCQPWTVPVGTLDGFCYEAGLFPDWIVMDIEGSEVAALRGAARTLKEHRPRIIAELHPEEWVATNDSRATLEALLSEHRLEVIPLTGQKDALNEHGIVCLSPRS